MIRCKNCQKDNNDIAQYCKYCGFPLKENKNNKKFNLTMITVIILLVTLISIAGIIFVKSNKTDNSGNKAGSTAEKKEVQEDSIVLDYTDNENMETEQCLSPECYQTITSEDQNFSFAYPKYLFNGYEVREDGNGFQLYYDDEEGTRLASLNVYDEENIGDSRTNTETNYRYYKDKLDSVGYSKIYEEPDEDGMTRAVVSGYKEDMMRLVYTLVANDGERDYVLEIEFYGDDLDDPDSEIGYITDCVYRYCSFGKGNYKPRTYQQFVNHDLGETW